MNYLLREGTQKDWQHFGGWVSEKWPKKRRHSKHACVICFCFFFTLLVNFVLPRPFSHPSFFSFILSFFVPTFLPCLTEKSNKNGKYLYYVKCMTTSSFGIITQRATFVWSTFRNTLSVSSSGSTQKMKPTRCSETSAKNHNTLGNNP